MIICFIQKLVKNKMLTRKKTFQFKSGNLQNILFQKNIIFQFKILSFQSDDINPENLIFF